MSAKGEIQRLASYLAGGWRIEQGRIPIVVLTIVEAQRLETELEAYRELGRKARHWNLGYEDDDHAGPWDISRREGILERLLGCFKADERKLKARIVKLEEAVTLYKRSLDEMSECCGCSKGRETEDKADALLEREAW